MRKEAIVADETSRGSLLYPGYEQYWLGILANPQGVQPLTGKVPSSGEVAYARFADKTPHVVLPRTLEAVGVDDDADRA